MRIQLFTTQRKGLEGLLPVVALALGFLVHTAGTVHAQQWANNGSNIYNINNGDVGIGIMIPWSKFHVHQSAAGMSDIWITTSAPKAAGTGHYLSFGNAPGGWMGRIAVASEDASENGYIAFMPSNRISGPAEQVRIVSNGNVGIGTTSPSSRLHVVGDVTVTGNISAKYQDIAEWVPTTQRMLPGTVVILDPARSNSVVSSFESYDTRVAGVISANPGIVLGDADEGKVKVATTGRVKVRVDATRAPIRVGDLLVTSDRGGRAMRSEAVILAGIQMHRPGTLIGKALEPLDQGEGEILILLSLQ